MYIYICISVCVIMNVYIYIHILCTSTLAVDSGLLCLYHSRISQWLGHLHWAICQTSGKLHITPRGRKYHFSWAITYIQKKSQNHFYGSHRVKATNVWWFVWNSLPSNVSIQCFQCFHAHRTSIPTGPTYHWNCIHVSGLAHLGPACAACVIDGTHIFRTTPFHRCMLVQQWGYTWLPQNGKQKAMIQFGGT